jgi:glycosyltransferase involved in cell wall biosynthesis
MRCETHLLLTRSRIKQALRKPVMTLLYRRLCARCLAIGSRNRDFYFSFGVPQRKVFCVPYAVDNEFFAGQSSDCQTQRAAIRNEIGASQLAPLILFASKLTTRKRPQDLLDAYFRLRQRGLKANLVFVGSGELDESLRQFVLDTQVPDVFFLGFRNQSELPCLFAAADIFVLPSEDEPWGLIINEVMCAGLPVIASDTIGAVPDLVHVGDNGLTFPAGDVERLTDCLATLVEDGVLRRTMGRRSLECIHDWSLDRCVEGISAALRSLEDGNREPVHV